MALQDDLPQLILCPLLESYSATLGNDVLTTQYTSGMPRQRPNGVGMPHSAPVQFRHKAQHQEYILKFWRQQNGKPFAMRLKIDSTSMEWYECRFVGEPQLGFLGGDIYEFGVTLVCRPQPINREVDEAYIWAYNQTGGDVSTYFNALEKLVNEDLPDALGSL